MVHLGRAQSFRVLVVTGLLLGSALFAEGANAQCADPRGNAYCSNGGLVNVQNPNPPTNVNVANPNPPTNVNVANPNPQTNVNVQNPNGGDSGAQNPNAPISSAATGQLTVAPQGGAPGDMLAVSGQGFGANNLMFLNVIDSSGQILDTDSRAFSCTETDDVLLNLYQDLGWGCSSGARTGPLNQTNADGTFVGAIQVPAEAAPGPARLCAKGVFPDSCIPITIAAPAA